MANYTEGFHCTFVSQPPEVDQSKCSLCQLIFREPHQVTCCGSVFCRVCIHPIKVRNGACPTCGMTPFTSFEDKRLIKTLYNFEVCCSNKTQGCQWIGKLEKYNDHLNCNPSNEEQLCGCEFVNIKCLYCSKLIQRSSIQMHQSDQCPRRPFSCEYCIEYKSYHEDVTTNHWLTCEYYPQECPQKCGIQLPRHSIVKHMKKGCPLTMTDCEFKKFGCEERPYRKDKDKHSTKNMENHLSLVLRHHKQLKMQLEEESKLSEALVAEKKQLQQELNALRSNTSVCPMDVILTNYKHYKRENGNWYSPPFYTHSKGYKMCLRVDANGVGKGEGTHTSLHIYLMKGVYDDQLTWPFRGEITLQLLNQENDKAHHQVIVYYDDDTPDKTAGRMTEGELSKGGRGNSNFIAHSDLQSGYLKNDCLRIRITDVNLT